MVKYVWVLILVMAFAAPAFAQDDYPLMELGFGYGNIALKDLSTFLSEADGRHSGFATHQAFNLNSVFAIENYFGYYGFGDNVFAGVGSVGKTELLTNLFGGKFNFRTGGPVFYGSAGIGGGWLRFPDIGAGTNNAFGVKFGGGVDVPIGESFAWKVDVSRMSFHFFEQWNSGMNISTGIVLKIQY
jgi:hypothetical protein